MRKIASAFILSLLAWFSGTALAAACDPNSPAVPCTYNETVFDTMMGNNDVHAFYKANSYFVDHSINQNPDYWDISNVSGAHSDGIFWWYGSFSGQFGGAGVDKTAAGFYWSGVGTTYPGYFRYPTNYTPSNTDGWGHNINSFGSLDSSSNPHVAEDWNKGTGCNDRGLPLYAIAKGTVETNSIVNGNGPVDHWGRSVLIRHDAPSGYSFLSGKGELLTTIWSMYAHVLKTGQAGYNSALDLNTSTEIYPSITKGDPVGQVGDADGHYSGACHLHLEILKDFSHYRGAAYSWSEMAYRTEPSELIANGLYQSSSIDFAITVHPYECSGTFVLDAATPSCSGTATSGNWTRYGAGASPELGYSGIIFSKAANVSGNATWSPNLPKNGQYKVLVYIPQNYATATNAVYTVTSNGNSSTPVPVDQSAYSSAWVDIGTYSLHKTGSPNVVLTGNTGESGKVIAVDAVRFQFVAP